MGNEEGILTLGKQHKKSSTTHISTSTPIAQEPTSTQVSIPDIKEVQKDLYKRVLDILATVEEDMRQWMIAETIFDYALFHLDTQQKGLAVRYACIGPEHEDGIHALHEIVMYGTHPWSSNTREMLYWGNTHLGGWAATQGHMQLWDTSDNTYRFPIDADQFEQSACAEPVTRAGRIAGVLMLSSTQPGFFTNVIARQAVHEYALLLSLAFCSEEFKPLDRIHLYMMPELSWQRDKMKRSYINRVLACVQQQGLSRQEAEIQVRYTCEQEFAEYSRLHNTSTTIQDNGSNNSKSPKNHSK